MLKVDKVNVSYGELPVLWDVSISLGDEEIVVLLGPNGHGKTTLLKTISGLLRPSSGSITFDGEEISRLSPIKIVERGIIHIPGGASVFPDMTVHTNLLLGAYTREAWRKRSESFRYVYELFPVLKERKNQLARTLSGGERQMLALGRGLMSSANVLMIDEPSMGLAPTLAEDVYNKIEKIRKLKVSILVVEQNVDLVADLADRFYLIENGRIISEGTKEILDKVLLKEAYIG